MFALALAFGAWMPTAGCADESAVGAKFADEDSGFFTSCGDGTCDAFDGEECGICPEDCGTCNFDGGDPMPACGDGTCDAIDGEACGVCPEDCGDCPVDGGPPDPDGGPPPVCGDGTCDAIDGEACGICPEDCGDCPVDGGPPDPDGGPGGCMLDSECDDGEFCNGDEICMAGSCALGTDPDCEDNKVCTVDYCGTDACINEFSENLCTCDPPPTVDITVTFEKEIASQELDCPVVGGKVKDELKFTANGSGALADCGNECTESLSVDATLSLKGEFCGTKGLTLEFSGTGAYSYTKKKCLECDEATCEQVCSDGGCRTDGASGTLGITLSRFYGINVQGGAGPVTSEFKCGATVSGGVNVGMGATVTTELSDCVDCEQCVEVNATVGATLGGSADCYVGFKIYRYSRKIGCDGCANISASPYFGAALRDGECGPSGCAFVGVNAQARASMSTTVGYGWFSVKVGCTARVRGCAEASDCASCSQCAGCSQISTNFSCRVN